MVISAAEIGSEDAPRTRMNLPRWLAKFLSEGRLGRGFWIFFTAAFFFDLGIGLYIFLFNLYLANLHFDERFQGFATGALTLGNVAATIPIGFAARRSGLRPVLLFGFVAAPLFCILRALILWSPAQLGLAFLSGASLCCWPVCFAPTVARLTTEKNRVSAFSFIFATGIGTGALTGLVGGYLPGLLTGGGDKNLASGIRLVLLIASGIAMMGIWPILKLEIGRAKGTKSSQIRLFHPCLYRFIPAFALWSVVTGSFMPFAAVFLQQHLRIPMRHVGLVFSASQLAQVVAVLFAPMLYRKWGTIPGIMSTQIATAAIVFTLGQSYSSSMAVACYLAYTGVQFMSGPGFYTLLMTRVPDAERSTASAVQNIASALCQAASAAITGSCLVRFGYPAVLSANSAAAVAAALLLFVLLGSKRHPEVVKDELTDQPV
jgi:MFS family permease